MPANIFHNNGQLVLLTDRERFRLNFGPAYFLLLEDRLYKNSGLKGALRKPDGLDVVLCTTRQEKQYTENVLDYLGIEDFNVLGRHLDQWKHVYKLRLIVDHIRENPWPELLLHLDAPDVLVTGDLQAAVDTFDSAKGCDLLFGAEKNSAPGSRTVAGIKPSERAFLASYEAFEEATYPGPFRYLNAGCFIGRKDFMLDLFSAALANRKHMGLSSRLPYGGYLYDDDQLIFRELHRQHHPGIQIDHENKVFQNLYATNRTDFAPAIAMPGGIRLLAAFSKHLWHLFSRKVKRRLKRSRIRVS